MLFCCFGLHNGQNTCFYKAIRAQCGYLDELLHEPFI